MKYKIYTCFHSRAKKYLKKLNPEERNRVEFIINTRVKGYIENNDRRYVRQEAYFSKLGIFDSTVYFLRINLKERAIISIDEDPIFEQVIVNIFTICSHDKLKIEITGIMESLYQKMIIGEIRDEEEV